MLNGIRHNTLEKLNFNLQYTCLEVFLRNVWTQILGNNKPKVADTVND